MQECTLAIREDKEKLTLSLSRVRSKYEDASVIVVDIQTYSGYGYTIDRVYIADVSCVKSRRTVSRSPRDLNLSLCSPVYSTETILGTTMHWKIEELKSCRVSKRDDCLRDGIETEISAYSSGEIASRNKRGIISLGFYLGYVNFQAIRPARVFHLHFVRKLRAVVFTDKFLDARGIDFPSTEMPRCLFSSNIGLQRDYKISPKFEWSFAHRSFLVLTLMYLSRY